MIPGADTQPCVPCWGQWVRRHMGAGKSAAASSFINSRGGPLYPPPMSHWSQANVSSKWPFLIGCHCLHHQSLGSQAGFSLALMWKLLLWLCGPTCCLPTLRGSAHCPGSRAFLFLLQCLSDTIPIPLTIWGGLYLLSSRNLLIFQKTKVCCLFSLSSH